MNDDERVGLAKLNESIFSPNQSWRNNAYLEPEWGAYVLGYREAADSIVENVEELGVDLLAYPVMFLYRHFLEIGLKHDLIVLKRYFREQVEFPPHHRLDILWQEVRSLMEKEWNTASHTEYYDAIEDRIKEFQQIDQESYAFRYPVTKQNTSSLTGVPDVYGKGMAIINLMQVKEVVYEMAKFIEGTINMVADHEDARRDYLNWIQQEYGDVMNGY